MGLRVRVSHLVKRRLHLLLLAVKVGRLLARSLEAGVHLLPHVLHTLHLVRACIGVGGGGRGWEGVGGGGKGAARGRKVSKGA